MPGKKEQLLERLKKRAEQKRRLSLERGDTPQSDKEAGSAVPPLPVRAASAEDKAAAKAALMEKLKRRAEQKQKQRRDSMESDAGNISGGASQQQQSDDVRTSASEEQPPPPPPPPSQPRGQKQTQRQARAQAGMHTNNRAHERSEEPTPYLPGTARDRGFSPARRLLTARPLLGAHPRGAATRAVSSGRTMQLRRTR